MMFWLGTHKPGWLTQTTVGLMVSRRRLAERMTLPRASAPWVLDSGGFTELSLHGEWTVSARQYVRDVRLYRQEIGSLAWAAPQDWMCEPSMIAKTGLSIQEHQRRTVANYLELRSLDPGALWTPVVQGWELDDYRRCIDMYDSAGVDLRALPVVGIGSVCRRQSTPDIVRILASLHDLGLTRLHGFGVKTLGLRQAGELFASADSLAWSFRARSRKIRLDGHSHQNCANCLTYALAWRDGVLQAK